VRRPALPGCGSRVSRPEYHVQSRSTLLATVRPIPPGATGATLLPPPGSGPSLTRSGSGLPAGGSLNVLWTPGDDSLSGVPCAHHFDDYVGGPALDAFTGCDAEKRGPADR